MTGPTERLVDATRNARDQERNYERARQLDDSAAAVVRQLVEALEEALPERPEYNAPIVLSGAYLRGRNAIRAARAWQQEQEAK